MGTRVRSFTGVFAIATALVVASLVTSATPAWAGGTPMYPVLDRYEPGDRATMVAYTIGSGSLGSVADGPFFAYLRTTPYSASDSTTWLEMAPFTPRPTDVPLGLLDVTPTGKGGYLEYRIAIQFTVPRYVAAGSYSVVYCNADCTKGISDLMGGTIWVGIDPPYELHRTWAPDEPEIANMRQTSLLAGPGWQARAEELRAADSPPERPRPLVSTVRFAESLQAKLRRVAERLSKCRAVARPCVVSSRSG